MDVVSIVDALYRPLQQMAIVDALYDYGIDIEIKYLLVTISPPRKKHPPRAEGLWTMCGIVCYNKRYN